MAYSNVYRIGLALRDGHGGRRDGDIQTYQRVRHNSREGAVRSVRKRIPAHLKPVSIKRVERERRIE